MKHSNYLLFALSLVVSVLSGCAAMNTALEHDGLVVSTQTSNRIFLHPDNLGTKVVYVDVTNTSGTDVDVRPAIVEKLESKGFKVTENPRKASYVLRANIFHMGKAEQSALREQLGTGYGSTLNAGIAGALIGDALNGDGSALRGAGTGVLVGQAAEFLAAHLVKNVTFAIIADLRVDERIRGRSHYDTHTARIVVQANQVNLSAKEAWPPIIAGLVNTVAGVL